MSLGVAEFPLAYYNIAILRGSNIEIIYGKLVTLIYFKVNIKKNQILTLKRNRMKNLLKTTLILSSFISFSSHAEIYYDIGVELGGETLRETTADDEVNAGGGLRFTLGYETSKREETSYRFSFSLLDDEIVALDGEASISTTVLEGSVVKNHGKDHFGGGLTLHMSPEYNENTDFGGSFKIDFDDAVGFFLFYEHAFSASANARIGGRITSLDYEVNGFTLDAGGVGIYIAGHF